ncbi:MULTISPECIES: hypothetical protein [Candidatus Ichthyocystis]|uniref:tRNA nucleotidyl transferase n=1 Tax=Candidatus Ichthyocystis hellenicum TaxID=1561003 RepID=A0A0S4M1R4_9BURK|nr:MULTISPECIES: hypothetical protein [Ichthyocystis]CUT17227.1 tRNA nucleotidyl transferase [Candidatus Ichthyocystis hellenicum]
MRCYVVGGAVRDLIMGLQPKDRDWVVVGASVDEMISRGFIPVGKDFPVFLHPDTKEEYALARTERKFGRGYKGFSIYASPDVTLDQDLLRRDLTINAIAMDEEGNIFDPFGGVSDIQNKIIRHVSPAFSEDPVRILRASRFLARYPDFSVDPGTLDLSRHIVSQGEVSFLVMERVWQELLKGLVTQHPQRMFSFLFSCGAFFEIFEELASIDCDQDQIISFFSYSNFSENLTLEERFSYYFSEFLVVSKLIAMSNRMKIPAKFRQMSVSWRRCFETASEELPKTPSEQVEWFSLLDLWRCPSRFYSMERLLASRLNIPSSSLDVLRRSFELASSVRLLPCDIEGYSDQDIRDILKSKRVNAIVSMIS